MKFQADRPRKVWNFDLDGVIAIGGPFWEREPEPHQAMIDKVRELYQAGNVIIIWTARQWEYAPETVGWLIKHKVPYHGIYMGKGGADHYVDDKAVNLEELILDEPKKVFRWTGDGTKESSFSVLAKEVIKKRMEAELRAQREGR